MGQQGTPYALERKVRILDEIAAGQSSASAIAEREGIPAGSLYNWKSNERAIRAAFAKKLKQQGKVANGSSVANGNGTTAHKAPPVEKEPAAKLQILGLTPLIKELVKAEIDQQLPGLVKEGVEAFFTAKRSS